LNRSTREIRAILEERVDFEALVEKLEQRALKGNERAAEILFAYRYGRPVQRQEVEQRHALIFETEEAEAAERLAEKALDVLGYHEFKTIQQSN